MFLWNDFNRNLKMKMRCHVLAISYTVTFYEYLMPLKTVLNPLILQFTFNKCILFSNKTDFHLLKIGLQ